MCWQTLAPAYGGTHKATVVKDEPPPVVEVACSKCEWKGAFSRAELMAKYGAEYPLPNLLDHLAMPGCSKNQKPVGSVRRLLCQSNRIARTIASPERRWTALT
jgi:hypothetical protein